MQLIAVFDSVTVEPCAVIDGDSINDESVAFPVSNRMSHECRVVFNVFGMLRSISVNQSIDEMVFEQNGHGSSTLHDLKRRRTRQRPRWAWREAEAVRV